MQDRHREPLPVPRRRGEERLARRLGLAIGRGRAQGMALVDRQPVGRAVDRGTRGEDDPSAAGRRERGQERAGALDVDVGVFRGPRQRIERRFQRGAMDHRLGAEIRHETRQRQPVADVDAREAEIPPGDGAHPFERLRGTADQVVERMGRMAGRQHLGQHVAADIAGGAGDQDAQPAGGVWRRGGAVFGDGAPPGRS